MGIILILTFALTGLLSSSSIAQTTTDPAVEEPIRSLTPVRSGTVADEVLLTAGTDAIALEAARCGAMGAMMPVVLLLALGLVRTRRSRCLDPVRRESLKSVCDPLKDIRT